MTTTNIFRAPIVKMEGHGFDTLVVKAYHEKSGYGGLDWEYREGGYKVSVTPCVIENGFMRSVLGGDIWSGFYVLAEKAPRCNHHFLKRLCARVVEREADIVAAWNGRDAVKVREIIKACGEAARTK